jgi:hypothetical protein
VKIHMSRSMAYTINTSRRESLFWPRRCKISGILTAGGGTLAVGGGTLMAGGGTLTVDNSTLTVNGGTQMANVSMLAVGGGTLTVDNNTLTVSDGTLISNGQHRLSGAIASSTRLCHHQHVSMAISLCGQHRLGNIIINMTQLCCHQAKQHPQYEDLARHYGRVGFNKDPSLSCIDQGRKSLPSSYFIIFSLPNIYVQIKPGVTLAWSSAPTLCRDQVASVA